MDKKSAFLNSRLPHILMITNHGLHEWLVIPGLPDTGGQNVFVNQFSDTLAQKGYCITIINRGGFPHPISAELRAGIDYKVEFQRIMYIEDDISEFVRKEDMLERLLVLAENLHSQLSSEDKPVDMIISHYWDGAELGCLFNRQLPSPVSHFWVPHSLGTVKKRNVVPERWADLRVEERIDIEKDIVFCVNGIASTSATIKVALSEDYGYHIDPLFLPPCIDPDRYSPKEIALSNPVWEFLSTNSSLNQDQVQERMIITEISRTDTTKRKDVLIRAFAKARQKFPQILLLLSIDQIQPQGKELMALIGDLHLSEDVIVLGSVWDELPDIYRASDIYCTPSIMEGFGMSAQEAAATQIPVIASDKVPFATEHLLGKRKNTEILDQGESGLQIGDGCIVVPADDVDGFANALEILLESEPLRKLMGKCAYDITIPAFTWHMVVDEFLLDLNRI